MSSSSVVQVLAIALARQRAGAGERDRTCGRFVKSVRLTTPIIAEARASSLITTSRSSAVSTATNTRDISPPTSSRLTVQLPIRLA